MGKGLGMRLHVHTHINMYVINRWGSLTLVSTDL